MSVTDFALARLSKLSTLRVECLVDRAEIPAAEAKARNSQFLCSNVRLQGDTGGVSIGNLLMVLFELSVT